MTPFHVSKSDFPEESLTIIRAAHAALNQQDKMAHKNWELTKQVGAGLVEVRRLAMSRAMTNSPYGRAYTAIHPQILAASKLDQRIKDAGDRQKLIELMDNLPAVEKWLEGLSPEDRRRWNHPTTIHRHWKASLRPPRTYEDAAPAAPKQVVEETLTAAVDALRKENARLTVEAGKRCDIDLLHSDVESIEKWLRMRILNEHKARRLRDILNELYPLPLPKVPVTHPDASNEDEIGLH
jgi:hypothetical protein